MGKNLPPFSKKSYLQPIAAWKECYEILWELCAWKLFYFCNCTPCESRLAVVSNREEGEERKVWRLGKEWIPKVTNLILRLKKQHSKTHTMRVSGAQVLSLCSVRWHQWCELGGWCVCLFRNGFGQQLNSLLWCPLQKWECGGAAGLAHLPAACCSAVADINLIKFVEICWTAGVFIHLNLALSRFHPKRTAFWARAWRWEEGRLAFPRQVFTRFPSGKPGEGKTNSWREVFLW